MYQSMHQIYFSQRKKIYLRVKFSKIFGCFTTTCLRSSKVTLPFRSFPAASNMTSVRSFRWSSPKNRELSSMQVVRIVFNSSLSIFPDPRNEKNGFFKIIINLFYLRKIMCEEISVFQYWFQTRFTFLALFQFLLLICNFSK